MIDLRCGDARAVLAGMADASVDAVVTDPPAGIGFMGVAWDSYSTPKGGARSGSQWDWQGSKERPRTAEATGRVTHKQGRLFREAITPIFAECVRVLKPGHQALVWALPRTSHWTAMALEDAGFYVADVITHIQGQGFPKSRSLLKPASEHWILCRAPGPLQPLQIDAARVPTGETLGRLNHTTSAFVDNANGQRAPHPRTVHVDNSAGLGRWPPNTIFSHVGGPNGCQPAGVRCIPADKRGQGRPRGTFPHSDDAWGNGHRAYTGAETAGDGTGAQQEYLCVEGCPVAELDRQAGPRKGATSNSSTKAGHAGTGWGLGDLARQPGYNDTGSASRFFPTFGPDPEDAVPFRYQPKASRRDRGEGNTHSTVKSTALMAWLCKLATPPGGVVLDCFAGSGSTGVACVREGFGFIGIEQDATYVEIMRARIAHEQERADGQLALPLDHACG